MSSRLYFCLFLWTTREFDVYRVNKNILVGVGLIHTV